MTDKQDPIAHAARLLREAAEELRQAHTLSSDRDNWIGEPEAKAAYDEHMAAAQALEGWEAAVGAGGVQALSAAPAEVLGWIYEDELPEHYPYDAMFPHSKVDTVRMFPVFGPQAASPTPPSERPIGEVVVTKTRDGQIVAVTRQDDEGRILSVIATSAPEEQSQPRYSHLHDADALHGKQLSVYGTGATTEAALGGVYAELPAPNLPRGGFPDLFTEGQMRDFADRTHALRLQAAPKAAPQQEARPCHVFTVRKAGGLTEWEPSH